MARISQALLAAALLTATVVVAAPASSKAAARKAASIKNSHRANVDSKARTAKRAKREVILDDTENEDEIEEDGVRRQLQDLSDQQLLMLADIVQNEIDKYDPIQEEYEIVQLPPEVLDNLVSDDDDDDVVLIPSRATRSLVPMVDYDDAPEVIDNVVDTEETPELVVIPEEVVSDADVDEIELRQRIAEIAQILNERAARRIEFV